MTTTTLRGRRSAVIRFLALCAAPALALGMVSPAHGADARGGEPDARAAITRIQLGQLTRGADTAVPYVRGNRIVEGEESTPAGGRFPWLLGTTPEGEYVVMTYARRGNEIRVVTPGGDSEKLLSLGHDWAVLGSDHTTLVRQKYRYRKNTSALTTFDVTTGEKTARLTLSGFAQPLDAADGTVLYSKWQTRRTLAWDTAEGATRTVARGIGYLANLAVDRLATFKGDPSSQGTSVVSTVGDPGSALWSSPDELVGAFSTDGSHLATVPFTTDGPGPQDVRVRALDGTQTGRYVLRSGLFDNALFEDASTLLLDTWTKRASGVVRCAAKACELASDLGDGYAGSYDTAGRRATARPWGDPLALVRGR
ncbi:hypothetical protein [Nocardioides acrostichi]|uniref:Uncharacterized protein n=1 Tax=Nocardioides acrostichi TaxID=2784339 RepID=A0A930UYL3_9ACTN|nr:hypothetical protein [Nocardioides acrostichi]MBF4160502.1 hypothetical protein [Nocardioides acrostichi]